MRICICNAMLAELREIGVWLSFYIISQIEGVQPIETQQ